MASCGLPASQRHRRASEALELPKACLIAIIAQLFWVCPQVGFLYWDGHISQKSFKKDHTEKAEAIWKTVAGDTSKLTRQARALLPVKACMSLAGQPL